MPTYEADARGGGERPRGDGHRGLGVDDGGHHERADDGETAETAENTTSEKTAGGGHHERADGRGHHELDGASCGGTSGRESDWTASGRFFVFF